MNDETELTEDAPRLVAVSPGPVILTGLPNERTDVTLQPVCDVELPYGRCTLALGHEGPHRHVRYPESG